MFECPTWNSNPELTFLPVLISIIPCHSSWKTRTGVMAFIALIRAFFATFSIASYSNSNMSVKHNSSQQRTQGSRKGPGKDCLWPRYIISFKIKSYCQTQMNYLQMYFYFFAIGRGALVFPKFFRTEDWKIDTKPVYYYLYVSHHNLRFEKLIRV